MLSDELADFLNGWADVGIALSSILYVSFVTIYGTAYGWYRTRVGRSVFFSFLSLLCVSAISFLAVFVGEDYWMRPAWRALVWTAAAGAGGYLLYALLKRWNKVDMTTFEPKTGSIPLNKEAPMAEKVVSDVAKLAAKRAFVRTTAQGYATSISASLILAVVALIQDNSNWLVVLVAVVTAIVTPPAAGLAAYFQWLGKSIPDEYGPASFEASVQKKIEAQSETGTE